MLPDAKYFAKVRFCLCFFESVVVFTRCTVQPWNCCGYKDAMLFNLQAEEMFRLVSQSKNLNKIVHQWSLWLKQYRICLYGRPGTILVRNFEKEVAIHLAFLSRESDELKLSLVGYSLWDVRLITTEWLYFHFHVRIRMAKLSNQAVKEEKKEQNGTYLPYWNL